ncbi:tail fiber protein of a prophage [Xenorhabdus mauleonii]|uniref:Tail fiber protein of a prophage n=1 Tax=Xenorhabdus mauleonii TaxID=351675 RepID=A0A1I3YVA6_9GAMM|nr:tail fiber assembly protein [Xenorhabdus mauleonii]PHM33346.1 tail fiber protein of a prophage [Xenorhabdus mauleonii]SFK35151.1 virus tail fibre assembly protein, lambda gpK [Xenorhabdus mauleonii]
MKYTTDIKTANFDENGFATSNGWVRVYRANTDTKEYICADMERTVIGVGLSAGAYLDAPELPDSGDMAVCRSEDEKLWINVPDHRGKNAYHIKTLQPQEVESIGELSSEFTLFEPKTSFDKWDGKQWITDFSEKQKYDLQQIENQKQSLLHETEQKIIQLERKVRLNMASKDEISLLREWEIYSVNLIGLDISDVEKINWPKKPE